MGIAITVTSTAANNVNLVDIDDADTDGFVDGITVAINSTTKGLLRLLVCLASLVEQLPLLQRLLTKLKL